MLSSFINPPVDPEGPHKMLSQIPAGPAERDVSGGELDAITRMEHGSLTAVVEPFIHHSGFGLALGPWGQGRLISQHVLERSQPREGVTK